MKWTRTSMKFDLLFKLIKRGSESCEISVATLKGKIYKERFNDVASRWSERGP